MNLTLLKASALLLAADREPEFDEVDAGANEIAFELGNLPHEFPVLLVGAKAHHALDARAVVPGAVEEDDLASGRQVLNVTLKVPLPAFGFGRRGKRRNPRRTGVEVLHEPFDRAALARRVAAFEDHHHLLTGFPHPRLKLQKLDLQAVLLGLVGLAVKCTS